MNKSRYQNSSNFQYTEIVTAKVTGLYPIVSTDRVLYADVAALDGRGTWKARVSPSYGVSRNVRIGMIVTVEFIHGFSNYAIITGHLSNMETDPTVTNPLPVSHQFVSDQTYEHAETGAFLRFRSSTATASNSGPDGSAAIVDLELASGVHVQLSEQGSGTSRNRGKVALTMPSGASITVDEPTQGQATLSVRLPSGFSLQVDASGNLSISTSGTAEVSASEIALNSSSVSLGGGLGSGRSFAFQDEVESLRDELQAHTHSNVRGGPDTSGPPTSTFVNIIGTANTHGV